MGQNNDVMMMGWLMGGLEKRVQKVRGIADGGWKFATGQEQNQDGKCNEWRRKKGGQNNNPNLLPISPYHPAFPP